MKDRVADTAGDYADSVTDFAEDTRRSVVQAIAQPPVLNSYPNAHLL
jgi:hypothetical protein